MKFLIVEDDLNSRLLLEVYLSPYGTVSTASNGQEAVGAYLDALDKGEPFHLICMDIMMPEMNGHEALSQIRQIERERDIDMLNRAKVIMTTALKDNINAQKAFYEEGCEAYLVKPIKKQAVTDWLERLGLAFGQMNVK
ncbi:MAG: response regulator [Phycisphaeraceae bacterium]|nr:response regulator [Phycisphaeraceae bacterium]